MDPDYSNDVDADVSEVKTMKCRETDECYEENRANKSLIDDDDKEVYVRLGIPVAKLCAHCSAIIINLLSKRAESVYPQTLIGHFRL